MCICQPLIQYKNKQVLLKKERKGLRSLIIWYAYDNNFIEKYASVCHK